jgi:ABC-type spermidine/putrescine transport system permease subunit I
MTQRPPTPTAWLLLAPAVLILAGLVALPVGFLVLESLREFVGGRVGGQADRPLTLANYAELLHPAYARYFFDTFRIGAIVSLLSLIGGFPVAYIAARTPRRWLRKAILGLLVALLVLSLVSRLYAIQMTFGTTGPLRGLAALLGMGPSSAAYAEVLVILGLLHLVLPITALTLVGTLQNVNPRLEEAAVALGASRWQAVGCITLRIAAPGLISAFLIAFAMCISNFVVPLILGRGVISFVSTLMYVRFSEIANYPSGAAIGVVMLILSFAVVLGLGALARRLLPPVMLSR